MSHRLCQSAPIHGAGIEHGEAQIWRLIFVRQVDVVLVEVEANGKGDKRVRRQWPEKNDPDKKLIFSYFPANPQSLLLSNTKLQPSLDTCPTCLALLPSPLH